MKTSLKKGLNDDQSKELELNFKASALFRKQLIEHIKDKIETKRKLLKGDEAFEKASWHLQAASILGYEKAMDEIISLLM